MVNTDSHIMPGDLVHRLHACDRQLHAYEEPFRTTGVIKRYETALVVAVRSTSTSAFLYLVTASGETGWIHEDRVQRLM